MQQLQISEVFLNYSIGIAGVAAIALWAFSLRYWWQKNIKAVHENAVVITIVLIADMKDLFEQYVSICQKDYDLESDAGKGAFVQAVRKGRMDLRILPRRLRRSCVEVLRYTDGGSPIYEGVLGVLGDARSVSKAVEDDLDWSPSKFRSSANVDYIVLREDIHKLASRIVNRLEEINLALASEISNGGLRALRF